MPKTLHFLIGELPDTVNQSRKRSGWQAISRNADHWRRMIHDKVVQHGKPALPFAKARLTLIRHSSREPDYDGLVASFKVVIDGLVKAGVIMDDKRDVIGIPDYRHQKAPRDKGMIEVICEEIT